MFALGIVLTATFLEEIAGTLGKKAVARRAETLYGLGFLTLFYASVAMIGAVIFFGADFRFSPASLPYFIPRIILEFFVYTVALKALTSEDRSTYAFLRLITIPLLLVADIIIGYTVGPAQLLGSVVIFGAIITLLATHTLNRRGMKYVLIAAAVAPITISLYKYNISHFNSVAAEQLITYLLLISYFTWLGWYKKHERPWRYLLKPIPEIQSLFQGLGNVMISFAYTLAPASVILSANRAGALLWAILFGNVYFHERHLYMKFVAYGLVISGLILLVI
ncbi:hypothetical protein HY380_02095 [Candidatus Saccharibacteria bacterium]|nr:hypothetical protein [Candidatus Saccharibacteria bacterium]